MFSRTCFLLAAIFSLMAVPWSWWMIFPAITNLVVCWLWRDDEDETDQPDNGKVVVS